MLLRFMWLGGMTMNAISIECVETRDKFNRLGGFWNELLAASDNDNPFMTHEWFSCWWDVFGGNVQPAIFVVKKNGCPVAIAPFMIARVSWRKMPVRALMFLGQGHASRSGLILEDTDPRVMAIVFHHVARRSSDYDIAWFDYIVKGSRTDQVIGARAYEGKLRSVAMQSDRSPYIAVMQDWDVFFKTRSSKLRQKIGNVTRRLSLQGDFSVVMHNTAEDRTMIDAMLEVSRQTWKYRTRTAIASSVADEEFYRRVAETAADKGWLNLWLLLCCRQPVAFAFNMHYKSKVYAMKIGYDERYGALSPGEYLNYHAIRECFDAGRAEYDWLGKAEAFKMRWTSDLREHCRYYFFSDSLYGKGLYMAGYFIAPAARHMRKVLKIIKGAHILHAHTDIVSH